MLVVDEYGRVLYVNQAVTGLLGWAQDQAEGRAVAELLPELDWEKLGGGRAAARA